MIWSTQEILRHLSQSPPLLQFALIAVSSAFTEEVAVIGVLGLARSGGVSWLVALSAIFVGTVSMNVGLWLGGRYAGHRALNWKAFAKFRDNGTLDALHRHVQKEGWVAVAISRFVPGTRLPVFVLSGVLDMQWHVFLSAITLSTIAWMLAVMGLFQVVAKMARNQPWLLVALLVLLAVWAMVHFWGKRSKRA